ncbi:hypothetical protein [Vulcanisaeta thermophila]|uniref:hypothetical protein n=1 Tax=Vulcanisaeta thermophila TaxID=867917 RepID=UPI0008535B25|nr:hypothetical protein [Vulcanisaeta thermophila]
MKLEDVVKYANVAYAGLMIGIAAYVIVLLREGYYFVPNTQTVSLNYIFGSGPLGPLALGIIPSLLVVMIISTVFIVLLNLYYEYSVAPQRQAQRRAGGRGKGGKR